MQAQVTIGSSGTPIGGALLQIKENEGSTNNSFKGLGMPRVKLTNKNKLYPMLASGYAPTEDAIHTGLLVYHVDKCSFDGQGLYVWSGTEWQPLSNGVALLPPGNAIDAANTFLEIPSGMDKRPMAAKTLTFKWGDTGTVTWSNPTPTIDGGLQFTNIATQMTPASKTWTTSPATLSVYPDAMTSALVTDSNPWQTRESKTTIAIPANDCGTAANTSITLNQTNYALMAGTTAEPIKQVSLRNQTPTTVNILSNVAWQASVTAGDASILLPNYTTSGGTLKSDGTYTDGAGSQFTYTSATGNIKYKTADITFTDVNNRAKDITISFVQCQGTDPALAGLATSTPAQTSAATNTWGSAVIRHLTKPGVYEEFYSASFGTAGRWMTTNLAARSYDSKISTATLPALPNAAKDSINAQWCYPGVSPTANTDYLANPNYGLLYNWPAAVAKAVFNNPSESGTQHAVRQGICPDGWHLPSDYEWYQLEQEIIRNTTAYAKVSQVIDAGGTDGGKVVIPAPGVLGAVNWRGTTHGQAMKETCGVEDEYKRGTSKPVAQGGFAALLAGLGYNGSNNRPGRVTHFWSSTSAFGAASFNRILEKDHSEVNRRNFQTNFLLSVRCKKD